MMHIIYTIKTLFYSSAFFNVHTIISKIPAHVLKQHCHKRVFEISHVGKITFMFKGTVPRYFLLQTLVTVPAMCFYFI